MNATRKITLGTLAAAAIFGGGVMAGRHWANDTSEPPSGPNRIRARTVAGTRSASSVTPKQARYRATTTFQINQISVPDIFPSSPSPETRDALHTNWFEVQVKAISSRRTLLLAVKKLKLVTEWKRSPDDAATRLAGMIKVEEEPNADIVSLSAWSDKAEEATAIANGVRDAYEQQRRAAEAERRRRLIEAVYSQIAQQQAAVEKERQETLELMKKHNIADLVSPGAMEDPQTSEIPDNANPAGPGVADQIAEVVADTYPAAVVAEQQKQPGYATGMTRYEDQVQLLNSILEHSNEARAREPNPIDILENAVAVEDR